MDVTVKKGAKVHAKWFVADPVCTASLSGVQPKTTGRWMTVDGVVTHIRGDAPVNPSSIGVWIKPDSGGPDVVVDSRCVSAVA